MATQRRKDVSTPVRPTLAELVVAGGLLHADGAFDSPLSLDDAIRHLRRLLTPAALWQASPLLLTLPEFQDERLGRLPLWSRPPGKKLNALADTLRQAWRIALPPPTPGLTPVLRLQVADEQSASQLSALGEVSGFLIVPSIAGLHATGFNWRWPLRIGIADSPRRAQWHRQLEESRYEVLFDVSTASQEDAESFDIVLIDTDYSTSMPRNATCIIALGEKESLVERLARLRESAIGPSITISAATTNVDWFETVVREMAQDKPIDVAMRIASPTALISADAELLPWTAVRQWSFGLARQLREHVDEDKPEAKLQYIGMSAAFDSESKGATQIAQEVKILDGMGFDTTFKGQGLPTPDGPDGPNLPPRVVELSTPSSRRLIADAYVGRRVLRKALQPDTEHALQVRIAIPGKRENAAQDPFDDSALPADTSVTMQLDAVCAELGLQMRQPIVLSTVDRTRASTIAVFPFRTLGEGTVVDIKLLVTYHERPLQEAHYVASVRAEPLRDDVVSLIAVALSSTPEPDPTSTPAQVSLEVNGANLMRSDSRDAVDLSATRELQDLFERAASRVLAGQDAPDALDDENGRKLLIALARMGAEFKRNIEALQVGDAKTISLLVDASTSLLPLELIYDARAPKSHARFCEHRRNGAMVGKAEICSDVGPDVVCPYGFWGPRRVIARTVRLRGESQRRKAHAPLSLRPVLYAAVDHADYGAPPDARPSDALEAALVKLAEGAGVMRVHDWEEWKRKVRGRNPQLMVVLAHTEGSGSEIGLEIGSKEWLYSPEVAAEYVTADDSPPPLVVLLACSTAVARNCFGGLPGAFVGSGAGAVVATLTKLRGPHGAKAAAAVVQALCDAGATGGAKLGAAMTAARRLLIDDGHLSGLLLVSHGDIDLLIHPGG